MVMTIQKFKKEVEQTYFQSLNDLATLRLTALKDYPQKYTERDMDNICLIFLKMMLDKMWDLQDSIDMKEEDRLEMAGSCGREFRNFVNKFTGVDLAHIDLEKTDKTEKK